MCLIESHVSVIKIIVENKTEENDKITTFGTAAVRKDMLNNFNQFGQTNIIYYNLFRK